jgi:flavodoxin
MENTQDKLNNSQTSKVLVVYDTVHGNTAQVAQVIAHITNGQLLRADAVNPSELRGHTLIIFGSPTHGGWYTEGIKAILDPLPALDGIQLAAFDTRTRKSIFGYAAPRILRKLEKSGGTLITTPPQGFVVKGIKGPLLDGELDRATSWATTLIS